MKTKFTDWLLKIVSYDESGHRVVTYQALYDTSSEAVFATAKDLSFSGAIVRIYEFKAKTYPYGE